MITTNADFKLFVKECKKWCDKLGIKNWSVHYQHEHIEGDYARTYTQATGGVATIVLSDYWDDLRPKTNKEIDRLALHETLHHPHFHRIPLSNVYPMLGWDSSPFLHVSHIATAFECLVLIFVHDEDVG